MEAGGVGIRREGCGYNKEVVGCDPGRFGHSTVVREVGYPKFLMRNLHRNGRETRGTCADGVGKWWDSGDNVEV